MVTETTESGFTLVAEGDFVGRGIWSFQEDDAWTQITYDWKIEANKPLLRYLSFLFKPLFGMNHEWAMRQGERSLALEVRRRAAPDDPTIPAPRTTTCFCVAIRTPRRRGRNGGRAYSGRPRSRKIGRTA